MRAISMIKQTALIATVIMLVSGPFAVTTATAEDATYGQEKLEGYIANAENNYAETSARARYAWKAAQMLLSGDEIPADRERGLKYLDMAASIGDPQVTYFVAIYYLGEENGTARNLEKGMQFLKKAATNEFPVAMYEYARVLQDGYELNGVMLVQPKPIEALVQMRLATQIAYPHPQAEIRYGKMLIEGYPNKEPQKTMTAINYLERAAGNGSTEGIEYLKHLLATDPEIKALYNMDNTQIIVDLDFWMDMINGVRHDPEQLSEVDLDRRYDLFLLAGLRSFFDLGIRPLQDNAANYWLYEMNNSPDPHPGTMFLVGMLFIQQPEQAQKDIGMKILQSLAQLGHYGALATLQNMQ